MAFKFEDLQPHVEMLIEALENKGSTRSGFEYNVGISDYGSHYRELLANIRNKTIDKSEIVEKCNLLKDNITLLVKNNQAYRIKCILEALDIFLIKEYNKFN